MRDEDEPIRVAGRDFSRNRRASTLIELLVVIAVVGFLSALLMPSLKRSMDLAAAAVCRHHLREIGHSLHMYRDENNGWFPVAAKEPSPKGSTETAESPWFGRLFPTYLADPTILRCPRDPYGYRLATLPTRMQDPAVSDFASYGLNNFMFSYGGGMLANVDRHALRRPLDTILSADLGPDIGASVSPESTVTGPRRNDSLLMWGDGFDPFSNTQVSSWLTTRHGVGIHMLTLAGGVRDVRTTELLRSPISRHYPSCAAGGCTLCMDLKMFHYTFAKDQLFWWTGSVASP